MNPRNASRGLRCMSAPLPTEAAAGQRRRKHPTFGLALLRTRKESCSIERAQWGWPLTGLPEAQFLHKQTFGEHL
jgi:hypothetical protein